MAKSSSALDFKSATLYALRAVLHTADTKPLVAALAARMRDAGAFYEDEPVVLDASELDREPDWAALAAALRQHGLHPIGVHAPAPWLTSAGETGLPPIELSASRSTPEPEDNRDQAGAMPPPEPAAPPLESAAGMRPGKTAYSIAQADAPSETDHPAESPTPSETTPAQRHPPGKTLVIRHPLRSGQHIYARGDLIVMGMVSQGAEIIADGHIHVYGPLRGKAIAGANGQSDAMIFTTQLDPELLAIAGVYRVVETRLPESLHNRAAQILLDGDTLRMQAL